ncbi:conserved hypothetical protein [Stigmatella aurantiaca DW4/3-1]|uniref:Uncharacterized protein n=1 Tax=Stigmatella aurantiaca (strain DW4/3-1) TaxID=378806 RepID=Q08NZ6_STIAD|nr:conserved hypothetical protein [Stigmatella aurantiaca DW4/3-1]
MRATLAHLPLPVDDVLLARQLSKPHRSKGVQTAGGDADLRPQPQLPPVVEAGGGVPDDRAGQHLPGEAGGHLFVLGDDGLGVFAAIAGDMGERRVLILHDPYGQDEIQELPAVVLLGRGLDRDPGSREHRHRRRASTQFHPLVHQLSPHLGQELLGDGPVDQQAFGRVADPRAARLGVEGDARGHLQVRRRVRVDVADALVVFHHRDARVLCHEADEPFPAARDAQVDEPLQLQQLQQRFPLPGGDLLDGVLGQPRLPQPPREGPGDGLVGAGRLAAPPEQRRVAALEAQGGRVARHVGTCLVDHQHHPQRQADLAHLEAVGAAPGLRDFSHGVFQPGQGLHGAGHGLQARGIQEEPVEEGGVFTGPSGRGHVLGAGGEDVRGGRAQVAGHAPQGFVLLAGGHVGEHAGGGPGPLREKAHVLLGNRHASPLSPLHERCPVGAVSADGGRVSGVPHGALLSRQAVPGTPSVCRGGEVSGGRHPAGSHLCGGLGFAGGCPRRGGAGGPSARGAPARPSGGAGPEAPQPRRGDRRAPRGAGVAVRPGPLLSAAGPSRGGPPSPHSG